MKNLISLTTLAFIGSIFASCVGGNGNVYVNTDPSCGPVVYKKPSPSLKKTIKPTCKKPKVCPKKTTPSAKQAIKPARKKKVKICHQEKVSAAPPVIIITGPKRPVVDYSKANLHIPTRWSYCSKGNKAMPPKPKG